MRDAEAVKSDGWIDDGRDFLNVDIAALAEHSEKRKRELRAAIRRSHYQFKGMNGRVYDGLIDAYHGETGFDLDVTAEHALQRAWGEILTKQTPSEYRDDRLYDKRQPLILRQLAAEKLFACLAASEAGVQVQPDEVIVSPYSSTMMLEEALATIARPNGVIVCPEGFYKNVSIHIKKLGLRILTCPNTSDDSFKIDPVELAQCLRREATKGRLCGVFLTLPGNPVAVSYSLAELQKIAQVLVESGQPIVCDMAFGGLMSDHIPLASLKVRTPGGEIRLYDRMVTITGNSKAYNAFGPCKFGAACSGNAVWLRAIKDRLTISFQRETVHLVRAIVEHTRERYFQDNRRFMRRQQARARKHIMHINQRLGEATLRPLGSAEGMFLTVVCKPAFFEGTTIRTSGNLEEALLEKAGVDSVALNRTGSDRLGVRLNILAPRRGAGQEQSELLDELFDRIEYFLHCARECRKSATVELLPTNA